jgi:hypothetical protein
MYSSLNSIVLFFQCEAIPVCSLQSAYKKNSKRLSEAYQEIKVKNDFYSTDPPI